MTHDAEESRDSVFALKRLGRGKSIVFLATTALSEFWEREQEVFFLGSWCLRYDKRSEWQSLRYQVMPSLWDDRKRFYQAAQYLDECGERLLDHLTDYLNSIHGVTYSQRYWRILVGPWLLHYLHVTYDRYVHLTEAFDRYPSLQTIMLDPRSFRVPRDTLEFVNCVCDDPYNLQIFSQLLQGMGYTFPAKTLRNGWWESGSATAEGDGKERGRIEEAAKWIFHRLAKSVFRRAKGRMGRVALCHMYIPSKAVWTLAFEMGLGALLYAYLMNRGEEWSFTTPGPLFDRRRNDLADLPWKDPFERILTQLLPQNFPTLYLEGYQLAATEILSRQPTFPPVVVSAVGWDFCEQFKFLAAAASRCGSRLVTMQHGSGYGIGRFAPNELHESRVADSYMVWGWADKDVGLHRNLPNPKLSSLLTDLARKLDYHRAETILFVATTAPRYLFRFYSAPVGSQLEDYVVWQIRFLAAAPARLRSTIIVRPHLLDYGHAIRQRVAERFADVRWDDGQSFYQGLQCSRIVVADHPGTSFLEGLVANIPIVAFWDPQHWEVRDEAAPYFEDLRKVGILWDSPEAAAAKVAEIYDEPSAWWQSEAVQEVRQRFVDRYALARKDWVDCWVKVLREEIALARGDGCSIV